MIYIKYFITMLIALALCSKCALAQSQANPKLLSEADLPMRWMARNLNLRADQTNAIVHLNMRYTERLDSIRSSYADRFAKFQKTYQVICARDNELKSILTEEQFIAYRTTKEWQKDAFSRYEENADVKGNEDLSISNY